MRDSDTDSSSGNVSPPGVALHGATVTDGVAPPVLVPTQILGVLLAAGSRHEHRHVPAHDLRAVAEHSSAARLKSVTAPAASIEITASRLVASTACQRALTRRRSLGRIGQRAGLISGVP